MIILGFFLHIKIKHWLINKLSVNWKGQGHVSRHELNNNNRTVNLLIWLLIFFFEGGGGCCNTLVRLNYPVVSVIAGGGGISRTEKANSIK